MKIKRTKIINTTNKANITNITKLYTNNKYQRFFFSAKLKIFDKKIYNSNKDYSATFNEDFNIYKSMLYDVNLKNLMNSLHVIRRDFQTLVFFGSNPVTCLLNRPSGKII